MIITPHWSHFTRVVGQSNRFSAPLARRFLSQRILTAGNNTLLAARLSSLSVSNCSACVGQDSTRLAPLPAVHRDRISRFVAGYPRQRLNGDHSKRARTDATLKPIQRAELVCTTCSPIVSAPRGKRQHKGRFHTDGTSPAHCAVQSLYLQPG